MIRWIERMLRQRVYTVFGLVLVACFALGGAQLARAQVDVTIHPTMTKGMATAGVTILEFSDYQ